MLRSVFVLSAAVLVQSALGQPAAAQDTSCANALSQQELNQCAYADWEAADAELNAVYKVAIAMLEQWDADLPVNEKGGAKALREAQRAWITFRDKTCEAEGYAMKGGSAEPLLVYGCMRVVTKERTAHLKGMIEGFGG
jgi:uncharacterized protein YecT (DUF1311 family)